MRILYVEDEKYLADAVIHILTKSNIKVDWAEDGEKGLELAIKPIYDAIVLDIMLPKFSGLDILKKIREQHIDTPVIMLSALSQVEDKVKGLNYGADDYLAKPFKTSELIARLNAIARRPHIKATKIITYADLKYDKDNRTVNGIALTEKEASILELLITNPGRTYSKEFLLSKIWGSNNSNDDNYVEVYISYLRKKLGKISTVTTVKTIRNLGYKICSKN